MSTKALTGSVIIGQSGGPSAVINASAYGVIKTALENENITKVYGAFHGIKGVLNDQLMIMDEEDPKELELLYFLAASPNQVFTREQLLDHIWGYEYAGDTRTVDVHIKRIREKIADTDQWSIGTVWSVGYRFEVHN